MKMCWKKGLKLEFFPIFIWLHELEYFNFNRFLSVQIKIILVLKNTFFVKKSPVCSLLDYQSTHVCMQLDAPFFTYFTQKKI